MENIYYLGEDYPISKIKCEEIICLSDFKYKSNDGKEYNMVIKNKGYHGSWHLIESLQDNKIYATNNLWYSNNSNNINAKIIEKEISFDIIKNKYTKKTINFINSFDYINDGDIQKIKDICKESIKKHFENKLKEDFKYNNLHRHIFCGADNDMDTLKIISYPKNMEINDKIYEVYHSSRYGGDCSEYFNNIYDAQKEFLIRLWHTVESMDDFLNESIKNKDIYSLYKSLIIVNKKYLYKKLLEDAYEHNIIFTKCKLLNDYIKNEFNNNECKDNIYIINIENYDTLKKLYNFMDYNYLDNKTKGEKICNDVLKELYPNYIFSKIRPSWLSNTYTNRCLELDLYNDSLKIAIEYNGKQHYEYIKYFHKNENDFINQQNRDLLKKQICDKNGIKLISISYKLDTFDKIKLYILEELSK